VRIQKGLLYVAVAWSAACSGLAGDSGQPETAGVVTSSVTYRPPECSAAVDDAIHRATARYRLPRWFYYAVVHRESTFNPNAVNSGDGGVGLTQLTNADHQGQLYPENLSQPDNTNINWYYDMGLNILGPWIDMNDVSPLDAPFDPDQNLDRFSSGYAAPAFFLFKSRYGLSDTEALRAVAYHWNKGLPYDAGRNYNPNDQTYLPLYDQYVAAYKPAVEADDGVWNGAPATPPYGGPSTSSFTSSATASPACIAAGATSSITGTFTDTGSPLGNGNVDIEVFNSAHANVGQRYYSNQSFTTNQTASYPYAWTAPSTPGVYSIQTGVFDASWNLLHWNSTAATVEVASDAARYHFECGATQGWTSGGGIITSIASSRTRAFQGTSSLAINITGAPNGLNQVHAGSGALPGAGAVVTFHVWIPAGSSLISVQPYVQQGAAGNWEWTGTWRSISDLTASAWNTITVTVPSTAVVPLNELGLELATSGAWTGTVYLDAITW
jgi:hypothetical protein